MSSPFLRPKFEGARFEGHRLPLSLLRELALLEELILDTAQWLYLKNNPDRKRLPRGWRGGFRLSLTGVEEGSAVPILEMEETEASNDILYREHFQQALDKIIEAIDSASQVGQPSVLPAELGRHFERIGASLQDGEQMVFQQRFSNQRVVLNTEVRQRLVRGGRPVRRSVEIVGTIPEMDQDKLTYQLLLPDSGRRLPGRFEMDNHQLVLKAFLAHRSGELFIVRGTGLFGADHSLKEIVETFDIEPEGQRIGALLEKFMSLPVGWYDGESGSRYSEDALHWLETNWYRNVPAFLPLPKLFPTTQGTVSAEWKIDRWDASLDIDLNGKSGYFHALELETDDEREHEQLDLESPEQWDLFVTTLLGLYGREYCG